MPAAFAFLTAATDASAPALSRMIAATRPRDRHVDQLVLLVRVVVVRVDEHLVAELARPRRRRVGFGLEEGIVVRRRDDRDALRPAGVARSCPSPASTPKRADRGDGQQRGADRDDRVRVSASR